MLSALVALRQPIREARRSRFTRGDSGLFLTKGGGSLGETGDGVVSYRSAHLDEAVSELIVRSGHSVQGNAVAIEEIRRILLQHLRTVGPAVGR